ncbi:MAG: asparaginase [Acidobacteriota bacterium]|nr:MAG: asparaginase [Acidobacteriota bacterium]
MWRWSVARVLILHTGGTLGMRPRRPDRALAPDEFGPTLLENVPELTTIADVDTRVLFQLDSSDVHPEHWVRLGREIADSIADYDGFVVTHGTDAMSYTAAALSFLLRNPPVPIILTGSQRPLADARTDGRANLVGAVDLATHEFREVCIYFDGLLLRGNRARKRSSFAFSAFDSPNFPPLAEVGAGLRKIAEPLAPRGPFRLHGSFDPCVAVVRLLPGQPASAWQALAGAGLRGLIVEAFGVGNLPVGDGSIGEALRHLITRGVVLVVGSQAQKGRVDFGLYQGGRLAEQIGALGADDMTPETASVKLMYLLGTLDDAKQVKRAWHEPIAGELTAAE